MPWKSLHNKQIIFLSIDHSMATANLNKPDGSLYCPRYVLVFHAKTRILSNFICPTLTIARRQVTTALWSLMQDTESEGGRSTKITSMLHQWIGSCFIFV